MEDALEYILKETSKESTKHSDGKWEVIISVTHKRKFKDIEEVEEVSLEKTSLDYSLLDAEQKALAKLMEVMQKCNYDLFTLEE